MFNLPANVFVCGGVLMIEGVLLGKIE